MEIGESMHADQLQTPIIFREIVDIHVFMV